MSYNYDNIISCLQAVNVWYIFGHENPDGDSIGTTLAFYNFAKRIGKKAFILSKNTPSDTYSFLPNFSDILVSQTCPTIDENSLLLICDTANKARSLDNLEGLLHTTRSIAIDHHAGNENFADINIVDVSASATGEIAYNILEAFNQGISQDEALCLYTAIVTDCGNFTYSCTTSRTHEITAKLLAIGVNPTLVNEALNKNMTYNMFIAWGLALMHTEIFCDGCVAVFYLTKSDFERSSVSPADLEGLASFIMRLKGVEIGLFLTERSDGIKLSIRSREPYSSREIASCFGGGGHACAAGATLRYDFATALSQVKEAVELYVARWNFTSI
ncbi:MAG: bifunctional oligoribonuclease/PAP phosphatase NrnA [Synergistaceae bacterium]|nr:bifunctional oligoribonuclease/PAP phosphatase NrnA [Synergistaceae bacterium]